MICKNCGCENKDGYMFCATCGAPLAREGEKTPEIPHDLPAETAPAAQEAPAAPVYASQATQQPYAEFDPQTAAAAQGAPSAPVYASQAPQQPYAEFDPQAAAAAQGAPAAPAYASQAPQQPYAPAYAAPQPAPDKKAPKPEKKRGKGGKIALIVSVIVLALALIAGGVFGYLLYTKKTDEISALEKEKLELSEQLKAAEAGKKSLADDNAALKEKYDALSEDYDEIWPEYAFFSDHAVICSEWNNYYHTYDCEDWNREGLWIYNSEYAEYKGYTPCPYCQADN